MRTRIAAFAAVIGLALTPTAKAGHHSWDFTEAFSNASGSIQYVELFCPVNGEAGLGPFTITAGANTLNFVTNLPSSLTANTWVLCATSNFASLPGGVTPDYIIPANFFSTAGGTLTYAGGADTWSYGTVPTDGVLALQRNGSFAQNSPTNFAGNAGSVSVGVGIPALPTWGLLALIGVFLLTASGLLRKRSAPAA